MADSMFHAGEPQLPADLAKLRDSGVAVDLDKVAETAEATRRAAKEEQDRRERMIVWSWHRAMRRAFKGIMPTRDRLRMLERAVDSEAIS